MHDFADSDLVSREYATTRRLEMRRLDRTAWLAGGDDPWLLALAAIAEKHPTHVLDAGCGTGDFAALVAAPDVTCVDSSKAAVAETRRRGLHAVQADVRDLPFADGTFDVVVANWMLYHVPDRARAIRELLRVLTSTGRFVGCYNAPGHLSELWSLLDVRQAKDDFDAANGRDELRRSFARVEAREATTAALWESRQRLQTYLDAYRELYGPLRAPDVSYPLRATRRNVVLVADRS
ncbi:MAG TPA: class I SAM-dependent methyltransferase [Gaiellales bacterium]|nr:class I SAM-dependent methyltransferase [Gaiellales bacterium]